MAHQLLSRATAVLIFLGALPHVTAQQLTKPVMQPEVPFASLDGGLWGNLRPTQSTHDQWGWGWIPDRCKSEAIDAGLNPYDIEVFNVHYTDCSEVFIMCRHNAAQQSQIDMIDIFGRFPIRMRQHIRHLIVLPDTGARARAFLGTGDITYWGPAHPILYAHEIGHILDWNAVSNVRQISASTQWLNAFNADPNICDSYLAPGNHLENFAQEVVIALYDRIVPGGIGTRVPNWSSIYNQYTAARTILGDILIPGGTCQRKFGNAPIVCMGPAAGCTSAKMPSALPVGKELGEKPKIVLDPEIERIPVKKGDEDLVIDHADHEHVLPV